MRVLVTGAAGLLGSRVVSQLLDKEHTVRAVVRPGTQKLPLEWRDRAEVVGVDLLGSTALDKLFSDMDVLIHLAAAMRGTADEQHMGTVVATEGLLKAMRVAGSTRHIVLAGSCSVYDWTAVDHTLNEDSPLEANLNNRDGYTAAKMRQEQITRRFAHENRWTLSVLRPGIIYGNGKAMASSAGLRLGRLFMVISPTARLRLTHVDNCAGAFVKAAETAKNGTFNIVDDERISAWRYAGKLLSNSGGGIRLPVPYCAGLATACMTRAVSSILPRSLAGKFPGILNPSEYRARFKPLNYDTRRAKEVLDWHCAPRFETAWSTM